MIDMAIRSILTIGCLCDDRIVDIISGSLSCDFCHSQSQSNE